MSSIQSFEQFLVELSHATSEVFDEELKIAAERWGLSPDSMANEFQRMRQFLFDYYKDKHPRSSYLDSDGCLIDCIPVAEQETFRTIGASRPAVVPTAPLPAARVDVNRPSTHISSQPIRPTCPAGTIPRPRITLDRVIYFGTLENYLSGGRVGRSPPPSKEFTDDASPPPGK